MYEERNMTPIIVVAVFVIVIIGVGIWYVIGRNRIIKPVPDGDSSSRVILVTPRATPTSVLSKPAEASDSAEEKESQEEAPTPTKKPAATNTPTAVSTATPAVTTPTVKPTEKQASASATPAQ